MSSQVDLYTNHGKIRIDEKFTFVDIPEDVVEQVMKQNGNYRIGKEKVTLAKAQ